MDKEKLTESEIKELLEKEKQERAEKCLKEINEVLTKYNCFIDVSAVLSAPTLQNPNGIKFMINILPRDNV